MKSAIFASNLEIFKIKFDVVTIDFQVIIKKISYGGQTNGKKIVLGSKRD